MDKLGGTTSEEGVLSWFILLSSLAAENTGTSVTVTHSMGEHLELCWVKSTGFIQEFLLKLPHQGKQLCLNFIQPQLYGHPDVSFQNGSQLLGVGKDISEAEV